MFTQIKSLYTTSQVRKLDKIAIEEVGISGATLMQRAGQAAFAALQRRWPRARRIIVMCGKGNNAGDGYVIAYLARLNNIKVKIFYFHDPAQLSGDALNAANICIENNIPMEPFTSDVVLQADVLVDALLGTGLRGDLSEEYKQAINLVNAAKLPVMAVDIPSGLNANTGTVMNAVINADLTVTFVGCKQGFFTGEGMNYCGEVLLTDLSIPREVYEKVSPKVEMILLRELKGILPKRQRTAYKSCFGSVLVVGGDYGMAGAVRMAGEAAARIGAGLVTIATRPEHVAVVSGMRPELMCYGVNIGAELRYLVEKATVIVIGPGLGKSLWGQNMLQEVLASDKPKLIDADGLNLLFDKKIHSDNWILTPHPGEAGRLLGIATGEVQEDRFAAVRKIVKCFGGVCVLKGAGTLVLGNDHEVIGLCAAGNPGMASGGMGDVLTGIIAGLVAQNIDLLSAARVGVLLHAKAADLAASENGERGLLATDLLMHARRLVNDY